MTPRIAEALAALEVDASSIQPHPRNARTHNLAAIGASLAEFGQLKPVVVQASTRLIVAGNGTWHAAVNGYADPRVVAGEIGVIDGERWRTIAAAVVPMTDDQALAFILADNRTQELGGYDEDALRSLLEDASKGPHARAIGYSSYDLDRLLKAAAGGVAPDELPDESPSEPITVERGQVWRLGHHRLMIGDAGDHDDVRRLTDGAEIGLLWTDPPYGVAYQTKLDPAEAVARHRRRDGLDLVNDDIGGEALEVLLRRAFGIAAETMRAGASFYVCTPSNNAEPFRAALEAAGLPVKQTLVWVKDVFVMGRHDYHYRHEPIAMGVKPKPGQAREALRISYGWKRGAAHYFIPDRTLDSVWEIPRPRRSVDHPTMKPVELVERSIVASTRRGEAILDPFVGSGTTVIAAERTNRRAFAMEIDPRYAQRAIRRWEAFAGQIAELED